MRNYNIFVSTMDSIKETFVSFTKNLKNLGLQIWSSLIVGLLLHQRSLEVHEQTIKETCKGSNKVESSPTNMHHEFNGVVIVGPFIRSVEGKVVGSTSPTCTSNGSSKGL